MVLGRSHIYIALWGLLILFGSISFVLDMITENTNDFEWVFLVRIIISIVFYIAIVKLSNNRIRDALILTVLLIATQWNILVILTYMAWWAVTGFV